MRKLLLTVTAFLLFAGALLAQRSITGTVTDDKGNPLPNVSVSVKGTSTGTVTKNDGTFSLTVPANGKELEFSFLGLTPETVTIGSRTSFSVRMLPAGATTLDDVVVTGIKNVKKSQFTGAANKITERELSSKPVGSFDQILQGRAPGILALTSSGQPGTAANIIIRGSMSISGGSAPLYIVDGNPVEQGVFQALNPNDFVSVDVLRDAATTALYGSRGSGGVIVVTTKRGQSGKMKLTYEGQFGIKAKPDFAFRPMTTPELLEAQRAYGSVLGAGNPTAAVNTNTNIPGWYYSPENPRYQALSASGKATADRLRDSIAGINTNWADLFFRQGTFSNHQINLSGGTGRTRIYSSIALYNEEGTTMRTDMKRVTLRNNLDYADDKFSIQVSTNLGYVKRNFQQSTTTNSTANPFLVTNIQVPYALVYKPNSENYATGVGARFTGANALDLTRYDANYNDQIKATLGVSMNYNITKDLSASFNAGADFRETQGSNYGSREAFLRTPAGTTSITGRAGFQSEALTRFLTMNVRPGITYKKLINDAHDLEVSAFGEYIQENQKDLNFTGYGIDPRTPNTPGVIQQGNDVNQLYAVVGGGKFETALASVLGMARYTFNNKYTVTGSIRRDGSAKVAPENRWTNFYSVGATWDLGREDFLQNVRFINVLRLRASYGGSGNHNNFPSWYLWQPTYGSGTYSGLPTQVATYVGNPDAKWESTWVTNIGLDFELANRRIYGDFNVYDKRTKDLFVQKPLPIESGGTSIQLNAGELQNKGFEWNINAEVIRTRDLVWTIFANGGYNKNKLLSLGGEEPYESGTSYLQVGLPLGSHYEVRWGGVDAATGQALYYDLDGKLTTTYNASNAVTDFGTWEAPWKGGFGTSLRYKGFDLNVLFSWQQGANKMDNLEYFTENPVGFLGVGYNQSADLKFWTKPGDIVNTPSPLYGTNFSSKLIHDASFIRLRDVTLSYTVPQTTFGNTKLISNVQVYVQGTNLYMWTKWRGMDPEAGPVNINLSEFPNPRAFTGGVRVTF